jgi:hypothetical protein
MDPFPDADSVLTELRAARPDVDPALTDAAAPAAVALRTRIVQGDTETTDAAADVRMLPRRPHARSTRWMVAAAAAAVVALIAVGAGVIGVDGPEPASASMEDIVAATDVATRGSGQATIMYEENWPGDEHVSTSGDIAFSNADVDTVLRDEDTLDGVRYEFRQRVVDGELYVSNVPLGDAPDWRPYDGIATDQKVFDVDPRLLLQVLADQAGFTVVGQEELDGRTVTHFRASTPDAVSLPSLVQGHFADIDSLDALDVWVGEDDVVYRLDMALTRDAAAREIVTVDEGDPCPAGSTPTDDPTLMVEGFTVCEVEGEPYWVDGAYSVRFHDLGTPVTIEPPANIGPPLIPPQP